MPELPSNFVANVASSTSVFISNLSPFAILIIGVLLGALVIGFLVNSVKNH